MTSTSGARDDGPARAGGFAGIESYGVIGDGKSVALVARDGAIDWWAAPAIDSPPVFAAVLGPRDGGCFTLEPTVPYQVKRRYLPGTNVPEPGLGEFNCGIWELDERRHNTFSKVGCWVALDRLIRLAERGQVSDRDADRWQAERRAIREWVDTHCWSDARRSYVGRAGSDDLDASLLLLARTGFLDGKDRRFTQTIKAIRAELAEGPLLYRFSGARDIEGAFVACSFWLIDALVRNGRAREARKLWHELISYVSDLGLLTEEIDPATGAFLGNVPQGLSHLALLNAAAILNDRPG